jgi:hypothetical protein
VIPDISCIHGYITLYQIGVNSATRLDVYEEVQINTPEQRRIISNHLREAILPLIIAELKAEKKAAAKALKIKESEERGRKVILYYRT